MGYGIETGYVTNYHYSLPEFTMKGILGLLIFSVIIKIIDLVVGLFRKEE